MSYTPRRIEAWLNIHERISLTDRANAIDVVMAGGSGNAKEVRTLQRKMREQL